MKPTLNLIVDNQVREWRKNGLLHREDGPAVIKGSGEHRVEEYWFEGCLVSAAMLELHRSLTPEVDALLKSRIVVQMDGYR
ncbi:hypothetical protein [Ralstonia pseudosolanacearum]|uniref:hypothetical protein n=1 Tax=Ralstonia pseudosolanacearum TaxID=1310165 RepID=UPI0026775E37|nr:hypothetical protein [Ralstonia pseudosolanacearum]MDO3552060.1 hypothetical protein [Ralstonia pseudosolanacearum]